MPTQLYQTGVMYSEFGTKEGKKMSDKSGKIWVNIETGKPHGGDQSPGDREATPEEYD